MANSILDSIFGITFKTELLKGDCQALKSSVNSQSLKEQTQIFILFMDIKTAEYHTWPCARVNCTDQKQGGTSERAMKKRRQQHVNSEGKKGN